VSARREGGRRVAHRLIPLFVALFTFIAFLPALRATFVTWDDDRNFLDNLAYRGLGWPQLRWMWTTFHMGHYVPLSWMTLGLDYTLWGMNAAGYHLTNLLLHTANAVIAYFLARRVLILSTAVPAESRALSTSLAAAFAALFFAIHPLRVESVAWVTERRDVLSELFYLSSVLLYLRAKERPEKRQWYWLSVGLFACALLSKATAVTLPAVLLLLNVYPLRRLGRAVAWWRAAARRVYRELAPFALLAAAIAPLTIFALSPPKQLTFAEKMAVSAYSLALYLWKTIVPTGLSPLYPMPTAIDAGAPVFVVSYLVIIALLVIVWLARRRLPALLAGCIAFLVIILPMLGVVQNGPQIAADRYTYHSALVLGLLGVSGILALARRHLRTNAGPSLRLITVVTCGLLAVLGVLTWKQAMIWQDSQTLWAHVVRLEPRSSIAHLSLANELVKQDRVADAIPHYEQSVALDPDYAEGHNNLGVALVKVGRVEEAIAQYQRAIALKPAYDEAHNNWGIALARRGDLEGAIVHYQQALALNPRRADAQTNWGNALVRLGRPSDAIAHYVVASRIKPDDADVELNWGVALARQGKLSEAIAHFQRALVLNPAQAEAKAYLERATELQREQAGRLP